MKILIDLCHPADVHLFRNFYFLMTKKGHQITITARLKDVSYALLDAAGIPYIPYGKSYSSILGKLFGMVKFDLKLLKIAMKVKPDICLSHGSFYLSHVAFLMRKPFITFEDTGNMEQIRLYRYFSDVIITPDSFPIKLGKNQIYFPGTKELAYLLPKYFIPDAAFLKLAGLTPGEKYIILRFVGWNASHDIGHQGISHENKVRLIEALSAHARVLICSEAELPAEFLEYRLNVPPESMHHFLYYAAFMYGESATMAAECSILGTPSIYLDDVSRCYVQEIEQKFGFIFNFTESLDDQEKSLAKALELISLNNIREKFRAQHELMLADAFDLTGFMVWFIENYPASLKEVRTNHEWQKRFITK